MFDVPSVRLGKLFGIPLEINLSWIVIFLLVAFSLSTGYYPQASGDAGSLLSYWVLGTLTSLLFFASIVAHELCHSLVTRAEGGQVSKITLFIFGGVASIEDEPRTPGREFLMASSGPAMSLLIAGLCFGGYVVSASAGLPWWVWAPLQYLASINLFVGVFNLLPGFPLDGGRVLRSILWAVTGDLLKSTRWATRSGQAIGWGLVALAVVAVLRGQVDAIWLGLVGWFIAWLAGTAYRQQEIRSRVAGVAVEGIMTPHPDIVSGDLTLEELAHEHFLGGRHSRYPVLSEGAVIGLVALSEVKGIARTDWPYVTVREVTNRDLGELSVAADTPVEKVLSRLAPNAPGALLVVREGRLVGILTRTDIIAAMQRDRP